MQHRTEYARSGDLHIAYQVVGDGPLDLVYVPGWVSHVELAWEEPSLARFLGRLASFTRFIVFDKRGTGLSDRVPPRSCRRSKSAWTTFARSWMPPVQNAPRSSASRRAATSARCSPPPTRSAPGPAAVRHVREAPLDARLPLGTDGPSSAGNSARRSRTTGERHRPARTTSPSKMDDQSFLDRMNTYFRNSASPGAAVSAAAHELRRSTSATCCPQSTSRLSS